MVRRQREAPDTDDFTDLSSTSRGDRFHLKYDDKLDIHIFTTNQNLSLLAAQHNWYSDGTFDSAPNGYQLYTVHVVITGLKTVPRVYVIMRHKDVQSYSAVYEFLKQYRNDLDPQSFMIDFEQAAITAIRHHFPNAHVQGCLFHFAQCLWRKIQALGLQVWYANIENAHCVKTITALAFVQSHDVHDAFVQLCHSLSEETKDILSEFTKYFETTWLEAVQRGIRRRPLFPVDMWNVHDRVFRDLPRTNNAIEGWHNSFHRRLRVTHPTMRRLVINLRKEQASNELVIEQVLAGIQQGRKRKKYDVVNERLKDIVERYHEYDCVLRFLNAVSHNL